MPPPSVMAEPSRPRGEAGGSATATSPRAPRVSPDEYGPKMIPAPKKPAATAKQPEPIMLADAEVADIAKRHRLSVAIVTEIIRRVGTGERSAIEREIRKGLARR